MTKNPSAEWDRLAGAALRARNALRVLLGQLDTAINRGGDTTATLRAASSENTHLHRPFRSESVHKRTQRCSERATRT